jgi:sodium-coupled neutral amino acid transporter 11
MYRDISKLAKASAFAMVALVFILLAVIIEGPLVDSSLRAPPSLDFIHSGFLQAVGVISFAFVCHHNSFLIYGSLIKPTLDRWEIVTHISTSLSWLFSLAMALAGYLIFGAKTEGNILNNYASDSVLMNFARLAFAANMFTTFPLECFVCREVIEHYFFPKQVISYRFHTLVTVSLTLVALAISLTTCDLGVVLEITGCFSATALAYILPPACYLKLADGDMLSSKKIWPLACACFGFLVMIVSTVMALVNAFSNTTKKQCVW